MVLPAECPPKPPALMDSAPFPADSPAESTVAGLTGIKRRLHRCLTALCNSLLAYRHATANAAVRLAIRAAACRILRGARALRSRAALLRRSRHAGSARCARTLHCGPTIRLWAALLRHSRLPHVLAKPLIQQSVLLCLELPTLVRPYKFDVRLPPYLSFPSRENGAGCPCMAVKDVTILHNIDHPLICYNKVASRIRRYCTGSYACAFACKILGLHFQPQWIIIE